MYIRKNILFQLKEHVKKLAQIQLQKELDNITQKKAESVYSLYSRIQETVSLLTFLVPDKFKNKVVSYRSYAFSTYILI